MPVVDLNALITAELVSPEDLFLHILICRRIQSELGLKGACKNGFIKQVSFKKKWHLSVYHGQNVKLCYLHMSAACLDSYRRKVKFCLMTTRMPFSGSVLLRVQCVSWAVTSLGHLKGSLQLVVRLCWYFSKKKSWPANQDRGKQPFISW